MIPYKFSMGLILKITLALYFQMVTVFLREVNNSISGGFALSVRS